MRRRRIANLEERMAWDQYASAWVNALGHTRANRNDAEEDPILASEYADDMLKERRKRFRGRRRKAPSRSAKLARLH